MMCFFWFTISILFAEFMVIDPSAPSSILSHPNPHPNPPTPYCHFVMVAV
jgi:hypothetical protein